MSYTQGGVIEANDYNTFRNQVNAVFGVGNGDRGYGQTTPTLPTVNSGDIVYASEWATLRNVIEICANHQGTPTSLLPPSTEYVPGNLIVAHDGITSAYDILTMINDIDSNRLNADVSSMILNAGVHTETINGSWAVSATIELDISFPSEDDARYFFNSGGQVRISFERTGGSSSTQNTDWTDFLNQISVIQLGAHGTYRTGSMGNPSATGYYELSTTPSLLFYANMGQGGSYGGNDYRFYLYGTSTNPTGTNGGNGSVLRLRAELADTGVPSPDQVDGDLSCMVDEYKAITWLSVNGFSVSVASPWLLA